MPRHCLVLRTRLELTCCQTPEVPEAQSRVPAGGRQQPGAARVYGEPVHIAVVLAADMDTGLCAHVPGTDGGVPTACKHR